MASTNVAASANGGYIVSASPTFHNDAATFNEALVIDGETRTFAWGQDATGGGWNSVGDAPADFIIGFAAESLIDRVGVVSLRDDYTTTAFSEKNVTTWSLYGLFDFKILALNAALQAYQLVATVTNNTFVWREVTFSPVQTSSIWIQMTRAGGGYCRLAEVQAWTVDANATGLVIPGRRTNRIPLALFN